MDGVKTLDKMKSKHMLQNLLVAQNQKAWLCLVSLQFNV